MQRDHTLLVKQAMQLLTKEGILFFSTNLRTFIFNSKLCQEFIVQDWTRPSIPPDFRNQKIHYCWEIKHKAS